MFSFDGNQSNNWVSDSFGGVIDQCIKLIWTMVGFMSSHHLIYFQNVTNN